MVVHLQMNNSWSYPKKQNYSWAAFHEYEFII